MKVTVLCNDKALDGYESEHGLSLLIEFKDETYLFDTGTSDVAVKNAEKLGLDLSKIDSIFISHGHYDHLGGLEHVLKLTGGKKVFVGEGALRKKFYGSKLASAERSVEFYEDLGATFQIVAEKKEVSEGISLLPAAPFLTAERPQEKFNVSLEGQKYRDLFEDELTLLAVQNGRGSVITGCSHRGIGNILLQAGKLCEIKHAIGGLHLLHKNREELVKICDELLRLRLESYHIGHCTGELAIEIMMSELPATVEELLAGQSFEVF